MAIAPIANAGDDAALEASLADGDVEGAMGHVVTAFASAVGHFCMALLGQQAEARDALHAVLTACRDQLPALGGQRPRTWVFGLALSECQRRQQSGFTAREDTVAFSLSTTGREAAATRKLLARIPRDQREAALLRYVGRLDYAEIGELTGVSEKRAEQRVGRALLNLRLELQEPPAEPRVRARA